MCTVFLRWRPGAEWPILLGAIRDEFTRRPWLHPAAHWPRWPTVQGGRDEVGGGTWLAVDRARGSVAALLNGTIRGPLPDGSRRPTRGGLVLAALAQAAALGSGTLDPAAPAAQAAGLGAGGPVPGIASAAELAEYDGFHLVLVERERAQVWSWDGERLSQVDLEPGDHIVVNLGLDAADDPLVPFFAPLLGKTGESPAQWRELLAGAGLDPADPRALLVRHEIAGDVYGSTSAAIVAVGSEPFGVTRFEFTATPFTPDWYEVGQDR